MAYYEGRKPEYPTQPHDPWTWFEIIRAPFVAPFVLLAFLWVKLRH